MRISRKVRIPDTLLAGILLFAGGCAMPSKPRPGADAQAEALSHYSLGLLAEANGDSAAAFDHFSEAVRLDPDETAPYPPAAAEALKLNRVDEAVRIAKQMAKRHPDTPEAQLLLARVYALTGRSDQAGALFEKIHAKFPDDAEAILVLAQFYISQERRADALRLLRDETPRLGENAAALHLLGTLCIDQARVSEDTPEARTAALLEGAGFLRQALDLEPQNPTLWRQLAFAWLAAGKPEESLDAIRKARELAPEDPALGKQMLDLLILTGNCREAAAFCDRLAADTATEPEIWFQYLAEQAPRTALPELTAFLEAQIREQPQSAAFYYTQLGLLYIGAGDEQAAETVIEQASGHYPDDRRIRMVRGCLRLLQKRYATAYAELAAVRAEAPAEEWSGNPFYLYNLLVAAQKSGHLKEAAETLSEACAGNPGVLNEYIGALLAGRSPVSAEEAVELLKAFHRLSPESAEALYYLMTLQAELKEYGQAIESAQRFEALAQSSSSNLLDGEFYYQYAALYERTGQLEEAEKLFRKSIEIGAPPLAAAAQNYIAYMWAERGEKLDTGLELIQAALAVNPDNGAFRDTLGWIYYMQGRYTDALRELQKAKDSEPDDPTVWEHLGDTWLKLNNLSEASRHWKKALELNPGSKPLIDRFKANGISPDAAPAAADIPAGTMPRP